jgi:TRAP-type C4-dicarboxylate transport system permease small subunit
MRLIEKITDSLANYLAAIAAVLVVVMMFHVSLDVFGKYFFAHPIEGTIEYVAAYYMVGIIFLPLAYVSRGEGQIMVDLFTQKLTGRKLRFLEGCVGICTLLYLGVFVWRTGVAAVEKTMQGEMWESSVDYVAVWPSRWFLPVGTAVMTLFVLHRVFLNFQGKTKPIVNEDDE